MKKRRTSSEGRGYALRLPTELYEAVQSRARLDGVSMAQIMENAIRTYLGEFTEAHQRILQDILNRLEALEEKIEQPQPKSRSAKKS